MLFEFPLAFERLQYTIPQPLQYLILSQLVTYKAYYDRTVFLIEEKVVSVQHQIQLRSPLRVYEFDTVHLYIQYLRQYTKVSCTPCIGPLLFLAHILSETWHRHKLWHIVRSHWGMKFFFKQSDCVRPAYTSNINQTINTDGNKLQLIYSKK